VDSNGNVVGKPAELEIAETVERLALHYHVLPSAILAESTDLLTHHEILRMGAERG